MWISVNGGFPSSFSPARSIRGSAWIAIRSCIRRKPFASRSGGSIENVVITGDFFSTTQDINRIENALKWASAREESIGQKLSEVWRDDMIYGVDVPTLTKAILLAKENQVRL